MNDAFNKNQENYTPAGYETLPEWDAWFSVSGDMDDFIFYDEPNRVISEK